MATSLTESAGLVKCANLALVKLSKDINIIKNFGYDFSPEVSEADATIKIPVVDAGSATAFDDSHDYETLTGSVSYVPVALTTQKKVTFKFSGKDVMDTPDAPYWNKCAEAGANTISSEISKAFGALFVKPGVGGVELGAVTKKGIAKLRKQCPGRVADTILFLAPDEYNDLLGELDSSAYGGTEAIRDGQVKGLYGFRSVVCLQDAGEGVKGALVDASAIAFGARGVAVAEPGAYVAYGTQADENGFPLTILVHGSPAKGEAFMNITSLWGMKVINADGVKILV